MPTARGKEAATFSGFRPAYFFDWNLFKRGVHRVVDGEKQAQERSQRCSILLGKEMLLICAFTHWEERRVTDGRGNRTTEKCDIQFS